MALSDWNGKVITVCRATMPSLKATALRDFIEILNKMGIYKASNHNKTEQTYTLRSNLFEFISIDQPDKIRGRKRNILFLNEANEIDYESWIQLLIRTTEKIIIDYNPSMEYHWIYDEVLVREDHDFYHSTYLDNPFLEPTLVAEIQRLQKVDENFWKIYGLGERGTLEGVIFQNWELTDTLPDNGYLFYGLDFGFTNDPTACVKIIYNKHAIHVQELFYKRGLTNRDIKAEFKRCNINPKDEIVADSAEPKSIEELSINVEREIGYNVCGVSKGADSVKKGIDLIKQYPLKITKDSVNLIKELKNYKWEKKKHEKGFKNVPIDAFNHAIDAMRYGCMENIKSDNIKVL